MSDSSDELYELLYGWSHRGLVSAGNADPFSGFLLIGARIDAFASLIYDVVPGDRKQGSRYARFVTEFFPSRYRDLGLGPVMWSDLRSAPIHFLSSSGRLALADSQPDSNLHLAKHGQNCVILHWPEFLHDFESARDKLWDRIQRNAEAEQRAAAALRDRPPLRVREISPAIPLPTPLPVGLPASGASAYAMPVGMSTTSLASTTSLPVTGGPVPSPSADGGGRKKRGA